MQDLRKLNDNKVIVPEVDLYGATYVLSDCKGAGVNNQCRFCAFDNVDGLCPTYETSEGAEELYCNLDYNKVWVIKPEVVKAKEPSVKPLEAPAGKKYDSGKPMYSLVPVDALEEVVKVLTAGAAKYNEPMSEENWRKVDNPFFRYYGAAMRHMEADRKGELIDIDKINKDGSISKGTDCHHLACAIASLMFMLQLNLEANK